MKDILFLIPLYYTAHFIERFKKYLDEGATRYSYDVYLCCSNPKIGEESRKKSEEYGFLYQERGNFGGGEGALWFLQKKSNIALSKYRYIWYFEESCEPIHRDWINRLIGDMDGGASLVGWDWHFEARKRKGQIMHRSQDDKGNKLIAYENTIKTGNDPEGNSLNKIWDVAGYRDEMFIVRSKDFIEFDYPDASDPFWEERNGVRGYGVRAERMWWDMREENIHHCKFPSPNIQWYVLNKYNDFPSKKNIYFWYFRELPIGLRRSVIYVPMYLPVRRALHVLRNFLPQIMVKIHGLLK